MEMGEFKIDEPLILIPYPNGGWVIEQRDMSGMLVPSKVGAYSCAEDMLHALKAVLVGED